MTFSLGIDVGTTAVKITVIDPTSLEILAVSREDHGSKSLIPNIRPNCHEQDTICILETVDKCLQAIPSTVLNKVSVINVAGQMHGLVSWSKTKYRACVDKLQLEWGSSNSSQMFSQLEKTLSSSITNLITWQDGRCSANFLNSLPKSPSPISTGFGCASLFWLQESNPAFLQKFDCAGSIMDLLVFLICSLDMPIMSPQIAHSWGYFDVARNEWEYSVLCKTNFPVTLLPKILSVGTCAGVLELDWHGIPQGTKVNVPVGDFQCSMLASCKDKLSAVLNLGTSAQLAAVIPSTCHSIEMQAKYPAVQVFPYFNETKVAVAASLNGGNAVDVFVNMLSSWLTDLDVEVPETAYFYKKFNEFCSEKSLDCGMRIQPTLLGERHCPNTKASVTEITKETITLPNVVRGLYRGIIENIFDMMPKECLQLLSVEKITGTGSVLVNSELVRAMVEKAADMPCFVESKTDASYGAALSCF